MQPFRFADDQDRSVSRRTVLARGVHRRIVRGRRDEPLDLINGPMNSAVMQDGMAVWANRDKVVDRVYFVTLADLCQRHTVMDVDEARKIIPV
jgi:hypothetical protein